MGIIKSIRKNRRRRKVEKKAAAKAAKARALAEVKADSKLKKHQLKLLNREEKKLIKLEDKALKKKRKDDLKRAQIELDKIKAGRFNADNVKRILGAARVILPFALPVVYRGITAAKEQSGQRRAAAAGVAPEQLAKFAGHGAVQKARLETIKENIKDAELPGGFKNDVKSRISDLHTAASNAALMAPDQRGRALSSVNREIDKLAREIQSRLPQ